MQINVQSVVNLIYQSIRLSSTRIILIRNCVCTQGLLFLFFFHFFFFFPRISSFVADAKLTKTENTTPMVPRKINKFGAFCEGIVVQVSKLPLRNVFMQEITENKRFFEYAWLFALELSGLRKFHYRIKLYAILWRQKCHKIHVMIMIND